MLNKTHLAIGAFFMLFFMHKVVHVWVYFVVFLIATLLPNATSILSLKGFKVLNQAKGLVKKRGMLHSFTLCFIITFLLAWFLPTAAFPFFLGYGVHLLADSWTVEGIRPFWPLKYESKGKLRRDGSVENTLFYSFIIADVILAWFLFF